jgi:hypothetical protein
MAAKRRRLDAAKMVADARRGFVDDTSVAHPPYGRAPGAARAEERAEDEGGVSDEIRSRTSRTT